MVANEILDNNCRKKEVDVEKQQVEETKSICRVKIVPKKYQLEGLKDFRDKIEEYFEKRKDIVKKVIKCEIKNSGNHVELVAEMKMKRGWLFFFCDPEGNYGDMDEIRNCKTQLSRFK